MKPDITTRLVTLGLRGLAAQLPDIIASATKKRWGAAEIIEHITLIEETERARRGLERRSTQSKLSKWKPMADFDWNWPTKIDRGLVESLLTLDFVEHANNVVLVANSGLGKTMIAQNLVHTAVLKGRSALFISASDLLLDLSAQESPRALERKLRHYAKIGLLVIDEVGFIPFESRNADLFFQLVSRRYEKKSLVLTTNLAFAEWNKIFPNAACATALIERIVHHADIVTIEGESYRVRESQDGAQKRRDDRKVRGKSKE
jgi:DNA replication protein DnaC